MKLLRATFLGVRGVPDGTYDLGHTSVDKAHDVVVVTGREASGKTRFLEAIVAAKEAIGPYGPSAPGAAWLADGGTLAKVVLAFVLTPEERDYVGTSETVVEGEATFMSDRIRRDADEGLVALLSRYQHGHTGGKLDYFPANRRVAPLGPFHGRGELEQRMLRASKDPSKYGFITRFLRELPFAPSEGIAFGAQLERLSPTCRFVAGQPEPGVPRCFRSRGGAPVSLGELSDTEQHAVLFAATSVAIGYANSIVLIDRPELSTTAARVGTFVAALRSLGPENQLILASAAPELLSAVPRECILSLEGADRA